MNTYKTGIIKDFDDAFVQQWKKLWEKAENATIYNSYEWFTTVKEVYPEAKFEVFACYENEKLAALVPLQTYRCFGISVSGTIDREHLNDTPFLAKTYDKTLLKTFFNELFKKNIYFQKIDDQTAKVLHSLFPNLFLVLSSVNPTINLTKDFLQAVSPSTLSQVKRIARKNQAHLSFVTYTDNFNKYLDAIFTMQKSSSKRARAMDIFEKEENKKYYKSLIKNCAKFIRINILYYDTLPITYEVGFLYKNHYIGDQISFHKDYRKLSPGKVLMFHLFEKLKKDSIDSLDMGGGLTSYKMSFTDSYRLLYNVYYSPYSINILWWKLINKTRRLKQIIFPKKHTRDHELLFKTFEK